MKTPLTLARRSAWMLPALVGAGSLFALPAALALDGVWDVLSWGLLAVPMGLIARALVRGRPTTAAVRQQDLQPTGNTRL